MPVDTSPLVCGSIVVFSKLYKSYPADPVDCRFGMSALALRGCTKRLLELCFELRPCRLTCAVHIMVVGCRLFRVDEALMVTGESLFDLIVILRLAISSIALRCLRIGSPKMISQSANAATQKVTD